MHEDNEIEAEQISPEKITPISGEKRKKSTSTSQNKKKRKGQQV